jgi:hypothetical protein
MPRARAKKHSRDIALSNTVGMQAFQNHQFPLYNKPPGYYRQFVRMIIVPKLFLC